MISLGLLTLSKEEISPLLKKIAASSYNKNINVYLFTPEEIKPDSELVHGKIYDHISGGFVNKTFPIPSYIYDRCYYSQLRDDKWKKAVVNWLKKRPGTIFLGYGLPNKALIYDTLSNDTLLKNYLPNTKPLIKASDLIRSFNNANQIILKPQSGSQGKGMYLLTKKKEKIEIQTQINGKINYIHIQNKERFIQWTKNLIETKDYLIQPFLSLQTQKNEPFDLRVLMQKDKTGQWKETGRGFRVGRSGQIASNVHNGGRFFSYDDFITTLPKKIQYIFDDEVNTLINAIPKTVEEGFGPLFELGIDIGIDQNGKTWVLDINSKPGHNVILNLFPEQEKNIYHAPLDYCLYLENKLQGVGIK